MRRFCKVLLTGMTNKVYPIQNPFTSLAYLVSNPLNTTRKWPLSEKGAFLCIANAFETAEFYNFSYNKREEFTLPFYCILPLGSYRFLIISLSCVCIDFYAV